MQFFVREILEATGGHLIQGENFPEKISVSTDTRTVNNNNIFLPLSGENFNGHDFINKAIEKGCKGFFTEKSHKFFNNADLIISVDNALEAYLKIARYARRKINPKVVAITGSSGKTTVKEFVYAVLSTTFKTHKSRLNHNNEVGLCQTLLSMPEDSQYAVIEMGMRGLGEIELLSKYSEPDIAVISNIGTAHIGRLGSIENIAKAKCEITSYLKKTGTLIAYKDDLAEKFCNWQGDNIFYGNDYKITKQEEDLTGFIYKNEYYEIPVMGEYNVVNAIAAVNIGKIAEVSYEKIREGLLNYESVGDRGKIINLKNGAKFIVDCYNANPDSTIAAINGIIGTYKKVPITLVLADMAELGDKEVELHKKVGEFISETSINSLITVGEKAKIIAEAVKNPAIKVNSFLNNKGASDFLANNLSKESVVLFKGSRCMKLEEIAEGFTN